MKGAGALLFVILFIVHCSLSTAIPISEEYPIKSATVLPDITDSNHAEEVKVKDIKEINEVKEVEEVKKPIEPVGPRWIVPTEYQPWPKFLFKRRPFYIRNVGESDSPMDQLPNAGLKSTHIDMDIADDNVDRALEKASHLLNRMKNTIKSDDGFFFLTNPVSQNAHPHLARDFLPLLNKMDQTVKKLAGVTVEHKKMQESPKQPPQLKPEDERRSLPRLYGRVKALEDTVRFLTWVVLILVLILLLVCVTIFLWVSCRLSPNVKRIENGEKGVELPMGRREVPKTWPHRVIPNTFRI